MREVKFKAKEGKILYIICLGLFCLTSGAWSHEVVELDNADEDGRGCARVTAQQDATGLLNKDGAVYFSSTDSGKHACGATNNNNFQKIRRCVRVLFTLITNGMKLFILLSVHFCIARSAHCRHFAEWKESLISLFAEYSRFIFPSMIRWEFQLVLQDWGEPV